MDSLRFNFRSASASTVDIPLNYSLHSIQFSSIHIILVFIPSHSSFCLASLSYRVAHNPAAQLATARREVDQIKSIGCYLLIFFFFFFYYYYSFFFYFYFYFFFWGKEE